MMKKYNEAKAEAEKYVDICENTLIEANKSGLYDIGCCRVALELAREKLNKLNKMNFMEKVFFKEA